MRTYLIALAIALAIAALLAWRSLGRLTRAYIAMLEHDAEAWESDDVGTASAPPHGCGRGAVSPADGHVRREPSEPPCRCADGGWHAARHGRQAGAAPSIHVRHGARE